MLINWICFLKLYAVAFFQILIKFQLKIIIPGVYAVLDTDSLPDIVE